MSLAEGGATRAGSSGRAMARDGEGSFCLQVCGTHEVLGQRARVILDAVEDVLYGARDDAALIGRANLAGGGPWAVIT